MPYWYYFMIILSVWRITHLLQAEDGPFDLVIRLRVFAGEGFFGKLLDCFYCLSLWTALPFALVFGEGAAQTVLIWLSSSGAAMLLEKLTKKQAPNTPYYFEEEFKNENNELLQSKKKTLP